jgi:hypothetical protein
MNLNELEYPLNIRISTNMRDYVTKPRIRLTLVHPEDNAILNCSDEIEKYLNGKLAEHLNGNVIDVLNGSCLRSTVINVTSDRITNLFNNALELYWTKKHTGVLLIIKTVHNGEELLMELNKLFNFKPLPKIKSFKDFYK